MVSWLVVCVCGSTRGRGLPFTFARVLVRAPVDGPSLQPTDNKGPHKECGPCSHAHFGCVPTACGSSPRDWVVSIGSHMQQNIDISFGASTSRRTASFVSQRSRLKTTTQKIGDNFPRDIVVVRWSVLQRVFSAPPGASCTLRKFGNV